MISYHAWINGPKGRLAPIEQAKLWALRKVLQKEGGACDQYQWMAMQVTLLGGGGQARRGAARHGESEARGSAARGGEARRSELRQAPFCVERAEEPRGGEGALPL